MSCRFDPGSGYNANRSVCRYRQTERLALEHSLHAFPASSALFKKTAAVRAPEMNRCMADNVLLISKNSGTRIAANQRTAAEFAAKQGSQRFVGIEKDPPPFPVLSNDRFDLLPLQVQVDGAVDLNARRTVVIAQILQGGVLDLHEVDARQIDLVPRFVAGPADVER